MITIAIVDDDKSFRDMINGYISQFFTSKDIEYKTILFSSGEEFLASLNNEIYDVVFMDVQMNGINGIDTSKKLREIDDNIIIIFFTNYSQYAIKVYEVNATDFVVKPINYDFFVLKMESIYQKISTKKKSSKIMLSNVLYTFFHMFLVIFSHFSNFLYIYSSSKHLLSLIAPFEG